MVVQMSGAYPFERPEDKHDTQKLAKMIQASLSDFHIMKISSWKFPVFLNFLCHLLEIFRLYLYTFWLYIDLSPRQH